MKEEIRIAKEYGKKFAFDGCHKIYILRTKAEEEKALKYGYNILNISKLEETYINSCPLKFISSFDLKISFIFQK